MKGVALCVCPNLRLLGLPSQGLGEDWYELAAEIDASLPSLGLELAEESVYLLFDRGPLAFIQGEGHCLVARPVVGPNRPPPPPFFMRDEASASAYVDTLSEIELPRVLELAGESWKKLIREGKALAPGFTICIRRLLSPELRLYGKIIFRGSNCSHF